jgi:hypothetical protein
MISTGRCLGTALHSSPDRVLGRGPEDSRMVDVQRSMGSEGE